MKRLIFVLGIVFVFLLIVNLANERQKTFTRREVFISQCAYKNTRTMNDYCVCTWNALENKYGEEGVATASAAIKGNKEVSMEVFQQIQPCVKLIK